MKGGTTCFSLKRLSAETLQGMLMPLPTCTFSLKFHCAVMLTKVVLTLFSQPVFPSHWQMPAFFKVPQHFSLCHAFLRESVESRDVAFTSSSSFLLNSGKDTIMNNWSVWMHEEKPVAVRKLEWVVWKSISQYFPNQSSFSETVDDASDQLSVWSESLYVETEESDLPLNCGRQTLPYCRRTWSKDTHHSQQSTELLL